MAAARISTPPQDTVGAAQNVWLRLPTLKFLVNYTE